RPPLSRTRVFGHTQDTEDPPMPQPPPRRGSVAAYNERIKASWRDLDDPLEWSGSRKGNRWRRYRGFVLVLFRSRHHRGKWGYLIRDGDDTTSSPEVFDSEDDARTALGLKLGLLRRQ